MSEKFDLAFVDFVALAINKLEKPDRHISKIWGMSF
jgi:hypothetical protein